MVIIPNLITFSFHYQPLIWYDIVYDGNGIDPPQIATLARILQTFEMHKKMFFILNV